MLKHEIATICNDRCWLLKQAHTVQPSQFCSLQHHENINNVLQCAKENKTISTGAAERQVPCEKKNWHDENSDQVKRH